MTTTRDYPRIVVPPPGPKARAIVERQDRFASTSYPKEYPLAVARGERAVVEDVDGNRFLDFMAGIAVASTGYGHPKVVKAVQDAAARFLHICGSDFYYESFAALCERLASSRPGPARSACFCRTPAPKQSRAPSSSRDIPPAAPRSSASSAPSTGAATAA